eukprot:scaffold60801_cov21-Tisochrysis_lutea.AAC.1
MAVDGAGRVVEYEGLTVKHHGCDNHQWMELKLTGPSLSGVKCPRMVTYTILWNAASGWLASFPKGLGVMEEDAQPLEVPIVAPIKAKKIETLEREPLKTRFTNEFMATLMANPELVRNVAIIGHLHHGKTTVMDMLVEQ